MEDQPSVKLWWPNISIMNERMSTVNMFWSWSNKDCNCNLSGRCKQTHERVSVQATQHRRDGVQWPPRPGPMQQADRSKYVHEPGSGLCATQHISHHTHLAFHSWNITRYLEQINSQSFQCHIYPPNLNIKYVFLIYII